MLHRSLISFLTIIILTMACVEDTPYRMPTEAIRAIQQQRDNESSCCYPNRNCSGVRAQWRDFERGQICMLLSNELSVQDDQKKAAALAMYACEQGRNMGSIVAKHHKRTYGAENPNGRTTRYSNEQWDDETRMLKPCLNRTLRSLEGNDETRYYCYEIATAFISSQSEERKKKALKKACDDYEYPPACLELREIRDKPLTQEIYQEILKAEEGKREREEEHAKSFWALRKEKEIEKREEAREEAEYRAQVEREESAMWSSALSGGLAALGTQMSGADPIQAELTRQLAQIKSVAPPPPRPVRTSAAITSLPRRSATSRGSTLPTEANHVLLPASNKKQTAPTPAQLALPSERPNSVLGQSILYADGDNNSAGSKASQLEGEQLGNGGFGQDIKPTTASPQSDFDYEPGGELDNCLSFFYDPDMYNWHTIRNVCAEKITWVSINPKGANDVSPGKKSCRGQNQKEVAQYPNMAFAVCRYGLIPVDANGKYWTGGPYRCRKKK